MDYIHIISILTNIVTEERPLRPLSSIETTEVCFTDSMFLLIYLRSLNQISKARTWKHAGK